MAPNSPTEVRKVTVTETENARLPNSPSGKRLARMPLDDAEND